MRIPSKTEAYNANNNTTGQEINGGGFPPLQKKTP